MSKRKHEKAIFEAFVKVAPNFAGEKIIEWKQPADEREFPDIICSSQSGGTVGVELGEWLNEGEIRAAKAMDRLQQSILGAVGSQGENKTEYIYAIWMLPKPKARIKPDDTELFRTQLFQYIDEVDRRWPNERFWQSPQGFKARNEDLSKYSVLQKYLTGIRFFPSDWYEGWPPNGRKVKRKWPEGQDWILFPAHVDWFSEDTMLQPLFELLSDKKQHYGSSGTGFDHLSLVIYYNSALLYNSPVETPRFKFADVVQASKEFLKDDSDPFDSVFLFIAIDDGRVMRIL